MLQRHKHGTHAPQLDSSVAIHYSLYAEIWREILEILEILLCYMQIAQILQLQCKRYRYHAVQEFIQIRYTLIFEECLDERAVIVVRLDQFSQIHSKYTGSTLMLILTTQMFVEHLLKVNSFDKMSGYSFMLLGLR